MRQYRYVAIRQWQGTNEVIDLTTLSASPAEVRAKLELPEPDHGAAGEACLKYHDWPVSRVSRVLVMETKDLRLGALTAFWWLFYLGICWLVGVFRDTGFVDTLIPYGLLIAFALLVIFALVDQSLRSWIRSKPHW